MNSRAALGCLMLTLCCWGVAGPADEKPSTPASVPLSPLIGLRAVPATRALHAAFPAWANFRRTYVAPCGPNGTSSWVVLWARPLKKGAFKAEKRVTTMTVVVPRGQGFALVRNQGLGELADYQCEELGLRWLNPRRKTGPVLVIPTSEGHALLALPGGWNDKRPIIQAFTRMSSSASSLSYQFDSLDEQGIFCVTEVGETRPMDDGATSDTSYTTLRWNGSGWK